MRADSHAELLVISAIMVSLAMGGLLALQQFSPSTYNSITGFASAGTTVNITGFQKVTCDFTLRQGLNLVSIPCVGDFMDISIPTENLTRLDGVFAYTGGSDPWEAYKPNLPEKIISDLDHLEKKKGYWFRMTSDERFLFDGPTPGNLSSISLNPGYNLVGYPSFQTENVTTAFDTIDGNYSLVVGFDPVSKNFLTYIPGSGGSLTQVQAYRGYWINVTSSDTWVID